MARLSLALPLRRPGPNGPGEQKAENGSYGRGGGLVPFLRT